MERLYDVLLHIEQSDGDVARVDLRRIFDVLNETAAVQKERLDGITRRGKIAAKLTKGDSDQRVLDSMDTKMRARQNRESRSGRFNNPFAIEGTSLEEQIDKAKVSLQAKALAYAELKRVHGVAWAKANAAHLAPKGGDGVT